MNAHKSRARKRKLAHRRAQQRVARLAEARRLLTQYQLMFPTAWLQSMDSIRF